MIKINKKYTSMIKQDPPALKDGMQCETLNLTARTSKSRSLAKTYFETKLQKPSNKGKGVLTYNGFSNESGTVFLGSNTKLKTTILSFSNQEGIQEFEQFRKDCLNLQENAEAVSGFTVSSIKAFALMSPPLGGRTSTELEKTFLQCVQTQQKSVLKTSIENNMLMVGGKTGSIFVQVRGIISTDFSVKKLLVSLSLKDKAGANFMEYLLGSIGADVNSIIAFFMVKQLRRITLTNLTTYIIESLVKSFNVNMVTMLSQKKERATTSKGKAVLRSLSTVLNKLISADSTAETKVLLAQWVATMYNQYLEEIPDGEEFIKELLKILTAKRDFTKTKTATSPVTLDRETFFRAPSPMTEEEPPKQI